MPSNIKIFGVRIDNFSVAEIKEIVFSILEKNPGQKFVTTLNPEILLKARQDEKYKKILNSAELNVCDGFGVKLASRLKGCPVKSRLAGADLADFILRTGNEKKLSILIIAARNSLSTPPEIERAIARKYPDLSVKARYFPGSQIFPENAIITSAEIVFVNFGAPDQERFIFENKKKFPNAKLLIGVGGTFDFLTGKIRRAPEWLRRLGLEWLWRLIQEPRRLRRILNATIIFPLAVLAGNE